MKVKVQDNDLVKAVAFLSKCAQRQRFNAEIKIRRYFETNANKLKRKKNEALQKKRKKSHKLSAYKHLEREKLINNNIENNPVNTEATDLLDKNTTVKEISVSLNNSDNE